MTQAPTLPLPAKRGLSTAEAASYMGLSREAFERGVRSGRLPGPWHGDMAARGTRRVWDRLALDAHLDGLVSGEPKSPPSHDWEGRLNDLDKVHGRAH